MMRAADIGRVGIGVDRAGDTTYVAIALQERRLTLLGRDSAAPATRRSRGDRARLAPGLTQPGTRDHRARRDRA